MSRGIRDSQRSRVYAWERRIGGYHASGKPAFRTIAECAEFLAPIWRAERGRYGRARVPAPSVESSSRGQTSAIAHADHRITLPLWARHPGTILHEAAHRLTPTDEAHGPRFVGVLIGLLARHGGQDAAAMMALADEMGVRYSVRSIGVVPIRGVQWQVARAVADEQPMTEMELACWLDVSYLQVRGAALGLLRAGTHRWLRGRLVSTAPPPASPAPRRVPGATSTSGLAKTYGITIERQGSSYTVWPPSRIEGGDLADPFEGDHSANDWGSVDLMVRRYVELLTGTWPTAQ